MAKMWAGRTSGDVNKLADDFNSSVSFDKKMYKQDIQGSVSHAAMLGKCGIISSENAEKIITALGEILSDIESGKLIIDESSEDIHMFIEDVLTKRIGDTGKMLHTARSRNDQVALDFRLYIRDEIDCVCEALTNLIKAVVLKAEEYKDTVMPGYTHLQRAQPILFSHHFLAYAFMLERDILRLKDARSRLNVSPIGSCALAGTTYKTDRDFEAKELGFDSYCLNSIDGVSDRDFAVEFLSCLSLVMTHLSRFSEEIILWSTSEFKFIELSDSYTTGSSIMPQKKNPDMAELTRGKTGRVYGDLISLLTTLKGIPLAYNKDMQEDKECVFDAVDTVKMCLNVFAGMIESVKLYKENMLNATKEGFINATDLADYLVKKGMPFRTAYKISGTLVGKCINENKVLEELTLSELKEQSELFDDDVYKEIDIVNCVNKRISEGGTSKESVLKQIKYFKDKFGF